MTSSPHGPYELGYTRATMVLTIRCKEATRSKSYKMYLSSDCTLQLECMKLELLVIADQRAAVNTFPGLVHTARHTMEVGYTCLLYTSPSPRDRTRSRMPSSA